MVNIKIKIPNNIWINIPNNWKKEASKKRYIIRKTENSISSSSWNRWGWCFVFFLFWLPLLFWSIYGVIAWNLSIIEGAGIFFIWLIFLITWFRRLRNGAKMSNIKNLKNNWWWIIKKVKITWIQSYHHSWGENGSFFNWYYLEAKEWNIIYCSEAFEWGELIEQTPEIEWFEEVYKDYWFEYNENYKEDVLNAIDKRIEEQQYILQNSWFFKRIGAKMLLSAAEVAKERVEIWYIPPQLEINWSTISVWDTVNVYIDPEDEKNYWMDIDFLLNNNLPE